MRAISAILLLFLGLLAALTLGESVLEVNPDKIVSELRSEEPVLNIFKHEPEEKFKYQYSAPFICGASDGTKGKILHGYYTTQVQIRNPDHAHEAHLRKRVSLAYPGKHIHENGRYPAPGALSDFLISSLKSYEAVEIGCKEIFGTDRNSDKGSEFFPESHAETAFGDEEHIAGFLMIESDISLDVERIITAGRIEEEEMSEEAPELIHGKWDWYKEAEYEEEEEERERDMEEEAEERSRREEDEERERKHEEERVEEEYSGEGIYYRFEEPQGDHGKEWEWDMEGYPEENTPQREESSSGSSCSSSEQEEVEGWEGMRGLKGYERVYEEEEEVQEGEDGGRHGVRRERVFRVVSIDVATVKERKIRKEHF